LRINIAKITAHNPNVVGTQILWPVPVALRQTVEVVRAVEHAVARCNHQGRANNFAAQILEQILPRLIKGSGITNDLDGMLLLIDSKVVELGVSDIGVNGRVPVPEHAAAVRDTCVEARWTGLGRLGGGRLETALAVVWPRQVGLAHGHPEHRVRGSHRAVEGSSVLDDI